MIFEEKKISSQRIYEGAILNVRRDKVTAYGGEAYREIIEHNGAVAMVPITEEGNIIMVEQFRYACGRAVLEIPAGLPRHYGPQHRSRKRRCPGRCGRP